MAHKKTHTHNRDISNQHQIPTIIECPRKKKKQDRTGTPQVHQSDIFSKSISNGFQKSLTRQKQQK